LFAFGGPTRVKPQTLGTGQIIRGCGVLIPTNLTGNPTLAAKLSDSFKLSDSSIFALLCGVRQFGR
jgi:hypothetical protein